VERRAGLCARTDLGAVETVSDANESNRFSIVVSEKTTEKIADVVVDIFKPVSQALGMLGDWVENRRGEQQAIRTLRRAQKIAEEHGKTLEEPPPKFLIPYLHGASLEDPADVDIRDKWATLLVNAGARPDSIAFYAASFLEKISSDEVAFLNNFVERSQVLSFATFEDFINSFSTDYNCCVELATRGAGFVRLGRLHTDRAVSAVLEQFQPYSRVYVASVNLSDHSLPASSRKPSVFWSDPTLSSSVFLMLDTRNIFTRLHINTPDRHPASSDGNNYAGISFLTLTELGFDLIKKIYSAN